MIHGLREEPVQNSHSDEIGGQSDRCTVTSLYLEPSLTELTDEMWSQ